MLRPIVTEIDLDRIERDARQMRAEMISSGLGRLGAWFRSVAAWFGRLLRRVVRFFRRRFGLSAAQRGVLGRNRQSGIGKAFAQVRLPGLIGHRDDPGVAHGFGRDVLIGRGVFQDR